MFDSPMKTQGEIEAAICKGISRFEQDYMGRGPKDIHAYLINDLVCGPARRRFDCGGATISRLASRRKGKGSVEAS